MGMGKGKGPSQARDEEDKEDKDDDEGEKSKLGRAAASVANIADYYNNYKDNMVAYGANSSRPQGQHTSISKASCTQAGPSNPSRTHHPQSADQPQPQPAKTQTASTSCTSALPPQPTDRDNRQADKIAAAEEAWSLPKEHRPSKASTQPNAQLLAKGKSKPRKDCEEERVEDCEEDCEEERECIQRNDGDTSMVVDEVYSAH